MDAAQIAALDILIQNGNVQAIQALWASLSPVALAGAMGVTDPTPEAASAAVAKAQTEAAGLAPKPKGKGKGKAKEPKPKGIAKKEKAPRAPRARSAYILWSIRERQRIKDTRPPVVFDGQAALMAELGRRWKALPEERKAKWNAKAAEEQREIDAKKAAGPSAEGEESGVEEEEE